MRTEVSKKDEELIVLMARNKNTIKIIADKTGYPEFIIKRIIKENRDIIDSGIRTRYSFKQKADLAIDLYKRHYPIEKIHKILGLGYQTVNCILEEKGIVTSTVAEFRNPTVDKINGFKNTVRIGDVYKIITKRDYRFDNLYGVFDKKILIKIIKKYPNIVITDKGSFPYFDLYMGEKISDGG